MPIEFTSVGDINNAADEITNLGAVGAPYQIGKYPITAAQWAVFLNAVASREDPHGLYNPRMSDDPHVASLEYSRKNDGSYHYRPITGRELLPITYVSYQSALRFCNWYQNHQPSEQYEGHDAIVSTEYGAYYFLSTEEEERVYLSEDALYCLPTEDQWFKAAYYQGGGLYGHYWLYPTQHETPPNHGDPSNMIDDGEVPYSNIETTDEINLLKPVNFFDQTQGAYGNRDMGSSVVEWMMNLEKNHFQEFLPLARGSSWASFSSEAAKRTAPAQKYQSIAEALGDDHTGFRIVRTLLEKELTPLPAGNSLEQGGSSQKVDKKQVTLPSLETIIQWSLFFIDLAMLLLIVGEALASALLILLGAEVFGLLLTDIPLLALFFSAEVSFSLALFLTVISFLMDWITNSGYLFDVFSFIIDLLRVF